MPTSSRHSLRIDGERLWADLMALAEASRTRSSLHKALVLAALPGRAGVAGGEIRRRRIERAHRHGRQPDRPDGGAGAECAHHHGGLALRHGAIGRALRRHSRLAHRARGRPRDRGSRHPVAACAGGAGLPRRGAKQVRPLLRRQPRHGRPAGGKDARLPRSDRRAPGRRDRPHRRQCRSAAERRAWRHRRLFRAAYRAGHRAGAARHRSRPGDGDRRHHAAGDRVHRLSRPCRVRRRWSCAATRWPPPPRPSPSSRPKRAGGPRARTTASSPPPASSRRSRMPPTSCRARRASWSMRARRAGARRIVPGRSRCRQRALRGGEQGRAQPTAHHLRHHAGHLRRDLRALLGASAADLGFSTMELASGAGHDAAFISRIAPACMLFIPCRDGKSHAPEEWAEPAALAAGARVIGKSVVRFDGGG